MVGINASNFMKILFLNSGRRNEYESDPGSYGRYLSKYLGLYGIWTQDLYDTGAAPNQLS